MLYIASKTNRSIREARISRNLRRKRGCHIVNTAGTAILKNGQNRDANANPSGMEGLAEPRHAWTIGVKTAEQAPRPVDPRAKEKHLRGEPQVHAREHDTGTRKGGAK